MTESIFESEPNNLYVDLESWTPEDGLTKDQVKLLIETLDSSRKDNEACAFFEDNDVRRERMLQKAADLKVLIAFFEDLIAD